MSQNDLNGRFCYNCSRFQCQLQAMAKQQSDFQPSLVSPRYLTFQIYTERLFLIGGLTSRSIHIRKPICSYGNAALTDTQLKQFQLLPIPKVGIQIVSQGMAQTLQTIVMQLRCLSIDKRLIKGHWWTNAKPETKKVIVLNSKAVLTTDILQ